MTALVTPAVLAEAAMRDIVDAGLTVVTAESCTAGAVALALGVPAALLDEDGNPVGLVYIGGASATGRVCATRHMFTGRDKSGVIEASVEAALILLRELCRAPAR
jgi:nicotinamide mononucleotide (NMN) deamidase PncC